MRTMAPGLVRSLGCLVAMVAVAVAVHGQTQSPEQGDALPAGATLDLASPSPNMSPSPSPSPGPKPTPVTMPVPMAEGESERARGRRRSLIGALLSPIRATFERARRMLSARLGGARDLVAGGVDELQAHAFRLFMATHNKSYAPEELPRRMGLFLERRKLIEQSVRDFAAGSLSFVMRENAFLDWDEDELRQLARASPPRSLAEMTDDEREAMDGGGGGDGDFEDEEDDGPAPAPETPPTKTSEPQKSQQAQNAGELSELPSADFNLSVRATERIPAHVDWRQSGCVAAPLNQLKCGACYAIATVGAIESMRCIKRMPESPVLSAQQVVDCSRAYKNFGCDGGWPTRVLKYLQDARVLARASCYPFVRRANACRLRQVTGGERADTCALAASPTDAPRLSYKVLNSERDILYHVATTGPVVTVMRATNKFLYYGSGIFDDPKCTRRRNDVDHAIVIVGYGRENGQDYWLIKNSWGTEDWGEAGYGKYKRGSNACSIGHWGWAITA